MAGAVITHYEVYALDGQRWVLHARFHGSERDASVEEAKRIERTVGVAAKVVREVYHPGNNMAEEQVVYISDKSLREASAKRLTPVSRADGGRAGGGGADYDGLDMAADAPAPSRGKKAAQSMGLLVKLTIVISVALVVAAAVTGVVSTVLEKYPQFAVQMSDGALSLLMFSSFVLSFLMTAVPLAMNLIDWQEGSGRRPRRKAPKSSERPMPRPPRLPVVETTAPPPPVPAVPEAPPPLLPPDAALPDESEQEPIPDLDAGNLLLEDFAGVPDLPPPEMAQAAPPPEPEKDEATRRAEMMAFLRTSLMQFLTGLLNVIKANRPQLDAYNKFGLDLMLSGAVELIGTKNHLESADKRELLTSTIESMGTKPDIARAFAHKVDEYLVEQRYMVMIQSGRSAMENFLAGAENSAELIATALDSWNKPQSQQSTPRIITVLFTDMVGSTDMTQTQGDQAAQTVVRRHNTIVRAALAQHAGKEVKHTGDGIMASFVSAVNGVEAAVAIQKAVAAHNAKHPDQSLHLRIGMNAGEPIEEEDDLFGSTVQLAARVCAKADTDQILCTNVVRELSAGKNFDFSNQGKFDLKGFRDPMELFEVNWKARKKA